MRRQYAQTLAGLRVSLSGAMPDREELERHGWSELDIRTAVVYFVEAVLRRGGEIVHGNHPTYTPLIQAVARQELGRAESTRRKQVKMYVVGPYVRDVEVAQLVADHSAYADVELVGPWDREELGEPERKASRDRWLEAMRERMSAGADVLVCIGGKGIRPDVPTPGVLDEARRMLEQGKPVLLAAALGGFAQAARERLPELERDNGLSPEENERLARAVDPSEVTELLVQGLERLREVSPEPEGVDSPISTKRFRTLLDRTFSMSAGEAPMTLALRRFEDVEPEPAPAPAGNKDSHLQMIQGVINRMGQNSFSLKGWAVTVTAGLFALAATGSRPKAALLALPSLLVFWLLDAYYLRQEHLFRALFDEVRRTPSPGTDYSMATGDFEVSYAERFWSFTERVFYLPLIALVLLLFAVLTFLP
jgi:SLOG cluster2